MSRTAPHAPNEATNAKTSATRTAPDLLPVLDELLAQTKIRDTFLLSYLANRLVLPVYEQIKRDFGLIRAEYLLLFCLSRISTLTAQQVADITGRPRNSISRAVHRMLQEGYLRRSPHPEDARQVLLKITPAGRRLNNKIVPLFVQQEELMLGRLSEQERKHLEKLLNKLAK